MSAKSAVTTRRSPTFRSSKGVSNWLPQTWQNRAPGLVGAAHSGQGIQSPWDRTPRWYALRSDRGTSPRSVDPTPDGDSGDGQDRLLPGGLNADLARDCPRDVLERLCRGTRLALCYCGDPHVGALAKSDVERDPTQEVEAVLRGETLAAASTEEIGHFTAMGADEARHVLDDSQDRHAYAFEHG